MDVTSNAEPVQMLQADFAKLIGLIKLNGGFTTAIGPTDEAIVFKGYGVLSFQLRDGVLLEEVRQVNQVLRVRERPIAAAQWWMCLDDRLRAAPINLLGRGETDELLNAARAAVE